MSGTVTYDCVPQVSWTNQPSLEVVLQEKAPAWFKKPIPGPALGPHMRKPGCNGAVCYCNDGDYCNSALDTKTECLKLLALLACLRYL